MAVASAAKMVLLCGSLLDSWRKVVSPSWKWRLMTAAAPTLSEEETMPTSMWLMPSSSAHDKYSIFHEQDIKGYQYPMCNLPWRVLGAPHPEPYVSVTAVSRIWPDSWTWTSQPQLHKNMLDRNFSLIGAIFFLGCLASPTLRMLNMLAMLSISPITFTRLQRDYGANGPEHMARTASSPSSRSTNPRWEFGGVGELSYDSPGHCKHGS